MLFTYQTLVVLFMYPPDEKVSLFLIFFLGGGEYMEVNILRSLQVINRAASCYHLMMKHSNCWLMHQQNRISTNSISTNIFILYFFKFIHASKKVGQLSVTAIFGTYVLMAMYSWLCNVSLSKMIKSIKILITKGYQTTCLNLKTLVQAKNLLVGKCFRIRHNFDHGLL